VRFYRVWKVTILNLKRRFGCIEIQSKCWCQDKIFVILKKNEIMGNTVDGFGKKRDHNQYGEVEKDKDEIKKDTNLPKPPNRGSDSNLKNKKASE
jgi:hypothetical protein